MKVKLYKGHSLEALKELLHLYVVDYFCDSYEFGGLMYDDWEGGFMLPYESKEIIGKSFFGLSKKYKYNVDTWSLVNSYLYKDNTEVYGKRFLERARGIIKATKVAEKLSGSVELNSDEVYLVDSILNYGGNK